MNNKRDLIFAGIGVFLFAYILKRAISRAVNLGTTIFLILIVFLMIYLLGHM